MEDIKSKILNKFIIELDNTLSNIKLGLSSIDEMNIELSNTKNKLISLTSDYNKLKSEYTVLCENNDKAMVLVDYEKEHLATEQKQWKVQLDNLMIELSIKVKELDNITELKSIRSNELESINKSIDDKQIEFKELTGKIKQDSESIAKSRKQLESDIHTFELKRSAFDSQSALLDSDIQGKIKTRNSISSEIEELNKIKLSLSIYKKQKDELVNEIYHLKELVEKANDKLKTIDDNTNATISAKEKEIDILKNELERLIFEIEEQKSIVLPRLNAVAEREVAVKKRENDINIIIDRYKKLYEDKGSGFMI